MASGGGGQQAPQFDAAGAAARQTTANVNTGVANAFLSNTDQKTPYGNLTFTQTGTKNVGGNDVPTFTATQTLSPGQQDLYDRFTDLESRGLGTAGKVFNTVDSSVSQPLDFSSAPKMPTDQTALRNQAYDALTARSGKALDIQTDQLKTELANQGIQPGSEAYDNAMRPLNESRVDASNRATIDAGNVAAQNLTQAQTLRDQSINETKDIRNQPLVDYTTLLGLGGGPQSPTYAPATQASIPATDVTSPYIAQYQGQTNAYNQQLASNNAMMGGLFGLGGSLLGAGSMIGLGSMFSPYGAALGLPSDFARASGGRGYGGY